MLAAVVAAGALLCAPAPAEMKLTKHNLSPDRTYVAEDRIEEVCVFCHTPFGAEDAAATPQWTRTANLPNTYGAIDSVGGSPSPTTSISVMCLSCHDGAQALNVQVMGPRGRADGASRWQAGSWFGSYQPGTEFEQGYTANPERAHFDEHPVGMRYAGGGISEEVPHPARWNDDFRRPSFRTLNGIPVWWVSTSADRPGTREKSDLPLYSLPVRYGNSSQTQFEPFVECASCHDPHGDARLFLRMSNAGSALCLACHNK